MTQRLSVAVVLATITIVACTPPTSPSRVITTGAGLPVAAAPRLSTGLPASLKLDAAFIKYEGRYAPQMRVTEISGVGGLTLTNVRFDIAGFPNIWDCGIGQRLAPGESRELFHEIYGDYPLSFDHGQLGSPGPVGVVLSYVDDSGRKDSISVSVPITPGGFPTTYTGGSGAGVFCGQGPRP